MKILFVEDDVTTRQFIEKGLARHGFVVDVAADGRAGIERGLAGAYDLLILDVMLPDRDGFEVLARLRYAGVATPVLFLSARGEVSDRVRGLDLGADDYLVKPFAFAELLARIRAIVRRRHDEPADGLLQLADLSLDTRRFEVRRGEKRIDLSPRQFAILQCLLRNQGYPVSRSMIIEKVWGYGFETSSNPIDVHITALRRKIDQDFEPKLLHTVRGVGYVLEDRSHGARPAEASVPRRHAG
jgi:two-component system copper resistance phosphate regulon response regulator CusR